MQQAQTVIRYPLLLGGNECLETGGDPEAQLMEERRLWLSVKLYLYAGLIRRLIYGRGVREHSPHRYQDNNRSNSKARGTKWSTLPDRSLKCQYNNAAATIPCEESAALVCRWVIIQPFASPIHSNLIWGHSSSLASTYFWHKFWLSSLSEPTSHIRNEMCDRSWTKEIRIRSAKSREQCHSVHRRLTEMNAGQAVMTV